MKKTKKYDASNSFCVLALSIHCFEILILLAGHGGKIAIFLVSSNIASTDVDVAKSTYTHNLNVVN